MLKLIRSCLELKYNEIMDVYGESLRNAAKTEYRGFDRNEAVILAEQDFYAYIREVFFCTEGAVYVVWEEKDHYISAARVEPYEGGLLIAGLETKPDCRNQGYGYKLLSALVAYCEVSNLSALYSHVEKRNAPSLTVHEKCGFERISESAIYIDGIVSGEACTMRYLPAERHGCEDVKRC
ncbi:MAG: GNAT family N-acetyltransferase [Oscillospiraceae bacterium]|nr:GNAT family N-acetyltransferase [Oscillospiraceae bacterium]